jgi:hypothetical protein
MLTLKELQRELEDLKKNKTNLVEHPQSKNKTPLIKRASALVLLIITGILGYAHKIPVVSKFLKLLSLWYGRTTWWKLLVYSRKLFVVSNAIIGVYTILSITGFSFDNIVTGIYVLGHTYLDNFISMTHKLFNWFLNLLDYKIVPRIPIFDQVTEDDLVEEEVVKNSYFFSALGVVVLGIVGTCITIGIIEYNLPNSFQHVPVVGSTIEYIKDIYYIWTSLGNPELPKTPTVPDQSPGQEFGNNFATLPISRSSSQDTITALDNSVLQTPINRIWELTRPAMVDTVNTTQFNHNPVNPNTLMQNNLRQLRMAAAQETIIDNIVNNNNPF